VATNGVYTRIVVPVRETPESERAVRVACGLAADNGSTVSALAVVEVPPLLPLDAHMEEDEEDARTALHRAQAIADSYGVALTGRIVRAREPAQAILEQAESSGAEVVVLGTERRLNGVPRSPVFGKTARTVLNEAPCRVVLVSMNNHHPG
jgi:basic amino acid/polyamine antiporter, APA family